jgi:hypothetical protein
VSGGRAAVPAGPVREAPAGFVPRAVLERVLEEALAGIELGAHDRRIVEWMAGWEASTVLTVASWVTRARAEVPAR